MSTSYSLAASPAYRPGDAGFRTAFVLSAPGRRECEAGRPAAGETGRSLNIALKTLHRIEPGVFPSCALDDYTLLNAWDEVLYRAHTGRTEAKDKDILGAGNICRVAQLLRDMEAVVALGDKARLAVSKAWPVGTLFTGRHPSLQSLNRAYSSNACTAEERRTERTTQWARDLLASKCKRIPVVESCRDTGLYVGYVPGVPGAHSQGKTLDELDANLREVVAMILEDGASATVEESIDIQTASV